MLLDPDTLALAHRATDAAAMVGGDPRFKLELPACQLEIVTPAATTVGSAAEAQLEARRTLADAANGELSFAAAGTHPFSPGVGPLNRGPRYDAIGQRYGCVAKRELVCALHIHVSIGDSSRALAVYNAARSYLPLLAALAANAPFYEGEDTKLASVRPKLANLLPRQGVPPRIESWESYREALDWGSASGALPNAGLWWWELRLNPRFGTLEFRVPDAQTTVADAAAIAAVAQTLAAWLGRRHGAGETLEADPSWRIEENRWSASRDGTAGEMADLRTGRRDPTRVVLGGLLDVLQPVASTLDCESELAHARELAERGGATRQRNDARSGGPTAVARSLAAHFLDAPNG